MTQSGKIAAFDVEKEKVVGILGGDSQQEFSFKSQTKTSMIKDFAIQPQSNKIATIDKTGKVTIWS